MAELLVRVVDKTHPDPAHNRGCTKSGDVIAACPDGWKWGTKELTNPHWIVVKLPGVPPSNFDDMLRTLHDPDTGEVLLKRHVSFNPATLQELIKGNKVSTLNEADKKKLLDTRKAKQTPGKITLG